MSRNGTFRVKATGNRRPVSEMTKRSGCGHLMVSCQSDKILQSDWRQRAGRPCRQHSLSTAEPSDMRILIIEEEEKAGAFLRRGLTEAGFVVDVVNT